GDHGADFVVRKHLVDAGLLGVDQLAAQREDRLGAAVAALLGRAAGGVALDDVELGLVGLARGAVGELARQAAAGEGGLADGLARLAGGLAGARGVEALVDDALGELGVGLEVVLEALADDLLDDAVDLAVGELCLGLAFEARLGDLHRDDRD